MPIQTSIAFLDSTVEQYELLLYAIKPNIEVHVLKGEDDGVFQITEILKARSPESKPHIYIISHGSPGSLLLGKSQLNLETLAFYEAVLESWSISSISIYGCRVAVGDAGAEFLEKLHQLTGASLSASSTLIGSGELGGNWTLDTHLGNPLEEFAFVKEEIIAYPHVLPTNTGPIAPDASNASTFNAINLSFSSPTLSHPGGNGQMGKAGTVALYKNAGITKDGTVVDVRLTLIETTDTGTTSFTVAGDDAKFNFSNSAISGVTTAKLKFEFFEAGTTTSVPISSSFTIKDLDKRDSSLSGSVTVSQSEVSTYGINAPTKLLLSPSNGQLVFTSTANNDPNNSQNPGNDNDPEFALQINYEYKTSFEILLTAEFQQSGFIFDGNRQFNFTNLITTGGDTGLTNENVVLNVNAAGILANDFDPDGDPLTVAAVNGQITAVGQQITLSSGALLTVNANGSYSYDPNGKFNGLTSGQTAKDSFIYTVSDGRGGTDDATVTITINGVDNVAPVLDLNGSANSGDGYSTTFTAGGSAIAIASPTNATGSDFNEPDIEKITIAITNLTDGANEVFEIANLEFPLNADTSQSFVLPNSGTTFSIAITDNGTKVTITKDGSGDLSQSEVEAVLRSLSYKNTASTPTLGDRTFLIKLNDGTADSNLAVSTITVDAFPQDDTITVQENASSTVINVLVNDPLNGSVSIQSEPSQGTALVNNNNEIEYQPNPHFSGVDSLTYSVNGKPATVTVTVLPIAEIPSVTAISATGIQNQPIALSLTGSTPADTDGSETLIYTIRNVPDGFTFTKDSTSIGSKQGSNTWIFTPEDLAGLILVPPPEFVGLLSLELEGISLDQTDLDGDQLFNSPQETDTKSSGIKTFTVTFQKDGNGNGIPDANEPPILDLNGNGNEGQSGVDYSSTFVAGGAAATIADPLRATGSDPSGDDIETITIAVSGLANGPHEILKIGNLELPLNTNSSQSVTVPNRSTSFSVSMIDSGSTITITKSGGGDLSQADVDELLRSLTYSNTASKPTLGDRIFTLKLNDGTANSNTAISTLTVDAFPQDDTAKLKANSPKTIIDVLANDPLEGPLSIQLAPTHGSVSINQNNQLEYIPNSNFIGTDTLTYWVNGKIATVTIQIEPNPPQPPSGPTGGGADVITGTEGNDILSGLSDNDLLDGGHGNDIINGGSEADEIAGGNGDDINNGGSGVDQIRAGAGDDVVNGGSGNDRILGEDGKDLITGGSGDDWIDGGNDNDILNGNSGNDSLYGGSGNDILQAGNGDDLLVGGLGSDILMGGQGSDRFLYESTQDYGDTILDFEILFDRLDLNAIYHGNSTFGTIIQAQQLGLNTIIQAEVGGSLQQVAILLNVNAFTIHANHFTL